MLEALACPTCGALNLAGQKFCGTCGGALPATPPSSTAFPTQVTAEVADAPATPADERRWVTVVFADIAGFTSMSEKLDFEEVRDIADRCAEVMGNEARRFGGTVLNVMGDAVMAVFGAPVAHDDDPERGVRAALAMVEAIPRSAPPEHNLALHIGVNSGEVMAGMLGPSGRRDYTVMGDTINTGARLEAAAVRGQVLVGRETYLATRHAIRYDPHDPVSAKGKQESVEAWLAVAPLAIREDRTAASSPLVGREREFQALQDLWKSAVEEPRARLVTLIAPPGLGKTRLAREFAIAVEAGGGRVLNGRSLPYGESTGYRPFADQVSAAVGLRTEMAPAEVAQRLGEHVTLTLGSDQPEVVANLLAMLGLSGDDSVPEKNVLFHSARRWLAALSRHQPTMLVFEDIHWADATLLELVSSVASRVGEVPVLILCLARPELLEQHPEWGAGQAAHSAITVEPLNPDAAWRLSQALARDQPDDVLRKLAAASGGNPLFLEELSATIADGDGTDAGQLPTSVKAIIGARLDSLDEGERSLLHDAAVIGDVFWRGALLALGGRGDVDSVLDELQSRGLVRREDPSAVPGDEQYIFKHALIREVAYGRLPRRTRGQLHAVVAAYMEKALGAKREDMASFLAHQWDEAGDAQAAARYHIIAGDRASKVWAKKEAIDSYSRAIELVGTEARPAGLADLLVRRARAFSGVGDSVRAAADLDQALPHLTGIERARALLDRGRVAFLAVDADGMVKYGGMAAEAAAALHDGFVEASAEAVRASASLMHGQLDGAIDMGARGLEHWPREHRDNEPDYADSMSNQALYHYWRGDYERGLEVAREAVDRALVLQALQAGAQGTAHLAMNLVGLGQYTEAMEWFERSVNLGLEWEVLPRYSGRSMNMWAGACRDVMNFTQARQLSERGLEMARRAKFPPAVHSAEIDLFLLDTLEGRLKAAESALPGLWTAARETKGFHSWLFKIRVAEAEALLALAMGKPEDGIEPARRAVEKANELPRRKYQAQASTTLARCLLAAGQVEGAVEAAAAALAIAAALGNPHCLWRANDALSRSRAVAGLDDGAGEAAAAAVAELSRFGRSLDREMAATFFGSAEATEILGRVSAPAPS